ncbi:MarR family winged helix-turn-helix transcriptional regulator [Alphaproteobacteria bacterium]|nr:MarR family winged helix-turn-helix transcriptional regulator [Alphaproteobacteria bacterium]
MNIGEICNCGLLRKSALNLTAVYNKALSESCINITQFALLKYISLLKETNISTLNTLLHQDRSTIGRNIRVIKNLQLIKSSVGKDKRTVKIEITELGKETLENAYLVWQKINKKVSIFLGDEKQNQLIEIMKDIDNIEDTKTFS